MYLTTTPDEEGLLTASISFSWGRFDFKPTDKQEISFYLTTQTAIEAFIEAERENMRRELAKEIADWKVDITPIKESMAAGMSLAEAEGVHLHATGYNAALDDVLARLKNES